ncbi:Sensor histidine kinase RcsC [Alphaproteobacteria bacterium SO-S41]|nr:Sensor histidine kinase RcsC [Alphaproteobacteria bacterium SO-S41]
MFEVLSCIAVNHDLRLVILAALVCLFACYTGVELLNRARESDGPTRAMWTVAAGTVVGCGVWATHFVAMLAFQSVLPIFYDVGLTALSVLAAITFATLGFAIGLRTGLHMFGGTVLGGAIATMHYLGMEALRGPVTVSWDPAYVAASLIIGMGLSSVALRAGLNARTPRESAGAAGMLTLGICAMHFTAMTAVTLTPVAEGGERAGAFDPTSLAVAVAAVAMLVIGLGAVATMMKHHRAERAQGEVLRTHVAELEATKRDLQTTSRNLEGALVAAAKSSEAKSQFLAAMSHELRTPLNAIIGYSDFLRMEPYGKLGDLRYLEYIGDIQRSGGHLLALINDVLDLARLDASRVELDEETVELGVLVQESLSLVAPQAATGGVSVNEPLFATMPCVQADARRLKQVLVNLLSNAVKFTPAGGRVTLNVTRTAGGAVITVADTGIGMRPEDIPVALDRFGQVESALARKYQGTGLGLPLARELIELHDGTLTIESALHAGTTVTVTLPPGRILSWPPDTLSAAA